MYGQIDCHTPSMPPLVLFIIDATLLTSPGMLLKCSLDLGKDVVQQ
jgi:hypothetical protein